MEAKTFYPEGTSLLVKYIKQEARRLRQNAKIQKFYKYEEALQYHNAKSQTIGSLSKNTFHIFSSEIPSSKNKGARYFLVLSLEFFIRYYKNLPFSLKNHYEVIRKNCPCKLYLDIEFYFSDLYEDPKNIITSLIEKLTVYITETFGKRVSSEDYIILDSTNEEKFSLHIILNSTDIIFQNNIHCGEFVTNFTKCLESERHNQKNTLFFDRNGQSIIDLSVYSKNRNFRLYQSSKLGQNRPLLISEFNTHPFTCPKEFLKDSLITYFREDIRNKTKLVTFVPEEKLYNKKTPSNFEYRKHELGSSLKKLDEYFDKLLNSRGGKLYKISETNINGNKIIRYYPLVYRYCNRVKREHKSNNIFFVVNCSEHIYWQQCFDRECKFFKSSPVILPASLFD